MELGNSNRGAVAGAMAVAGGFLMVASGYGTRGFLLTTLSLVEGEILPRIGGVVGLTASLAVLILSGLIALGGATVVMGGMAMLKGHATSGRFLILLGGGSGFLGLLVSFAYTAFAVGLGTALGSAPYWVGLVMAVLARRISRRQPRARPQT